MTSYAAAAATVHSIFDQVYSFLELFIPPLRTALSS
jgi:hypothetical protein